MSARQRTAVLVLLLAGASVWTVTHARSTAPSRFAGSPITIRSSAITAGGAKSSGGAFSAASTSGQPATGAISGGKFTVTGGFSPAPAFLQGDCNTDDEVDLLDYQLFESCLQGPNQPDGSDCGCFDLDASDAVDLADFAEMTNRFTAG